MLDWMKHWAEMARKVAQIYRGDSPPFKVKRLRLGSVKKKKKLAVDESQNQRLKQKEGLVLSFLALCWSRYPEINKRRNNLKN